MFFLPALGLVILGLEWCLKRELGMRIVCKRTDELSSSEWRQIVALFESVFERENSIERLKEAYTQNVLGYSFHAIIEDDDQIVGLNSYVPAYYLFKGEKMLFANSVTSMVAKKYRDFFSFFDMVKAAYSYMAKNGVSFVFGFPNDNSYPVLLKSKLMREIGKMSIHCLPYRIGGIKSALSFLNLFSVCISRLWVGFLGLFANPDIYDYQIHKEEESYNRMRYSRQDGDYRKINERGCEFVYKIMRYDHIWTAFLIDVSPKSSRNFNKALQYLIEHQGKEFDLILYIGSIPSLYTGLIRIPERFEPKRFNFMGRILDSKSIDNAIWDLHLWDTNLSNYDLL